MLVIVKNNSDQVHMYEKTSTVYVNDYNIQYIQYVQ